MNLNFYVPPLILLVAATTALAVLGMAMCWLGDWLGVHDKPLWLELPVGFCGIVFALLGLYATVAVLVVACFIGLFTPGT